MAKKKDAPANPPSKISGANVAFMKELLETPSPSGYEATIQDVVERRVKHFADEVRRDTHGNLVAAINPKGSPRIILCGHCDEIAMIVTHIDSSGYIWIDRIGGIDPQHAVGQRVWIHTEQGKVAGVLGRKPIHHQSADDRKRAPEITDLWVDIGCIDGKRVKELVEVGDPITFQVGVEHLRDDVFTARAMDDRIGVYTVMEALRLIKQSGKKPAAAIFAASTVQEEVGLRGATTATFGVDPQVGIAVDVGFATDFPTENPKKVGDFKMGGGPILQKGPNSNLPLFQLMKDTAKAEGIVHQVEGDGRPGGTDAAAIQISRAGVAAGLVSLPLRYMHSCVEMIALRDADMAAKLLAAVCLKITAKTDFVPRGGRVGR
ncbi:MAG: M20/M25/M40 family metallo-hydrolase [Planctomycetota bacterium]